jgi:predicted nucleotidyltransferase
MDVLNLLRQRRDEILQIAARNGAYNVRVFGSVARGDASESSDIDFLVDLEPKRSLFDVAGLTIELENLLCKQVDVVTEKGLRPSIRQSVLEDVVQL